MKVKIIVLFYAVISVLLLSGCQPTPETDVIVSSGTNKENFGYRCRISEMDVPEVWIEKDIKKSSVYTISANAQIDIPNEGQCRGVTVQRICFDKAKIQNIAEKFVSDISEIHIRDIELTKREIMEMIVDYEHQLAEGVERSDILESEINVILEELYLRLETAPENKKYGTLDFDAIPSDEEYFGEFTFKGRTMIISGIMCGSSINIAPQGIVQYEGWNLGDEILNIGDVGIEEHDAVRASEEFISGMQNDNMAVIAVKKARIVELNSGSIIPIYMVTYGKTYEGLSTVDIGTDYTTYPTTAVSDYAAPWPQDIINVYVSSDGVIGLSWNGASCVVYIEETECEMISFSQIQDRIREQLSYRYSYLDDEMYANIESIDICIDQIRLGYCIAGIKDNAMQSRLVPAWYVLYREFAEEDGSGTDAVLVIHAETGEILDPRITR